MQVVRHQRYVGRFACHGAAGAHGDAHVRGGQRGRIVHAVAHHHHAVAFVLQLLDDGVFVFRQELGFELGDARLRGDALCGALVVAGEHDHALEALFAQLLHDFGYVFLQRVLDVQDAPQRAVHRKEQRRGAHDLVMDGLKLGRRDGHVLVFQHEVLGADNAALAIDARCDAVRYHVLHLGMALAVLQVLLQRLVHHGAGNRMREVLFQAGCQAKHLFGRGGVIAHHFANRRRCLGKRARLVEYDHVGFGHMAEVARALHGEAALGAFALGRHNGDAARKAQGAGVVHHKRCRRFGKVACGKRHDACQQEVPRHQLVGHGLDALLVGTLQRLGLLYHRNDGAQLAFLGVARHADEDLAFFHSGAGIHGIARFAHDCQRLAGERALVHARLAADYLAIDRDLVAQAHHDGVALGKLGHPNFAFHIAFH